MLALGQWFIDKKTTTIFNQNNENQPLKLEKDAVRLLIFLAENQHKLIDRYALQRHLWPEENQAEINDAKPALQASLQQLITAITQVLGHNVITITPDDYYLLQLSTFNYQYNPITLSQMKQQLAEKQLIEQKQQQLKKTQQQKDQKPSKSTGLTPHNNQPISIIKKVLLVTIVALMIAAFLAAS